MLRKQGRWMLSFIAAALVLGSVGMAHAEIPYDTYSIDAYGSMVLTQSAYTPIAEFGKNIHMQISDEDTGEGQSDADTDSDGGDEGDNGQFWWLDGSDSAASDDSSGSAAAEEVEAASVDTAEEETGGNSPFWWLDDAADDSAAATEAEDSPAAGAEAGDDGQSGQNWWEVAAEEGAAMNDQTRFSPLSGPQDIYIDQHDNIYVADTMNNRIVKFSADWQYERKYDLLNQGDSFVNPNGVFVTDEGDIYVADTGNYRIVHMDANGQLIRTITRPQSDLLPTTFEFEPTKIAVSSSGIIYVATKGGYLGLMELESDGSLISFIGTNKAEFSFTDTLKKIFYTRKMYENELNKLPPIVNNFTMDDAGIIYTVTSAASSHQVKKLNIRGTDMLAKRDPYSLLSSSRYGENSERTGANARVNPQLGDIAVDSFGNMTVIDTSRTNKAISQYDSNGNLLFFWSGRPNPALTQLGIVRSPVAVAYDSSNNLYVLDDQDSSVQVFQSSEFAQLVYRTNQLTLDGKYEESAEGWEEVLRLNANYGPALLGLAKVAYKRQDYHKAMDLFLRAGNQKGYSDAYWQIRIQWIQQNFSWIANVTIGLLALWLLSRKFVHGMAWYRAWKQRKRADKPLIAHLKHALYILIHPIDGFKAIRYDGKGSYLSAAILLILALASVLVSALYTSFSFNMAVGDQVNLGVILFPFLAVLLVWIVSNYLISSIYRGEGRFRDVLISSTYCLVPLIVVGFPLTLLSNAMTLNEQAVYNFLSMAMYVWVGLLLYWSVQSVQNYMVGETFINIGYSAFTGIVISVLGFIVFGLTSDLIEFIRSILKEVALR